MRGVSLSPSRPSPPATVRPCGYCGKTIPLKWPRRAGRPPKYHARCAERVKAHQTVTARYNRCLANGGHKPSGRIVQRPPNLIPMPICANCDVPYVPFKIVKRETAA